MAGQGGGKLCYSEIEIYKANTSFGLFLDLVCNVCLCGKCKAPVISVLYTTKESRKKSSSLKGQAPPPSSLMAVRKLERWKKKVPKNVIFS